MKKKERNALKQFLDLLSIDRKLNRKTTLDNFMNNFYDWKNLQEWQKWTYKHLDKRVIKFLQFKPQDYVIAYNLKRRKNDG